MLDFVGGGGEFSEPDPDPEDAPEELLEDKSTLKYKILLAFKAQNIMH